MSPSYNHAYTHARLIAELSKNESHSVFSELALDIGKDYIPDISLYPKRKIDWLNDEVKVSEMPLLAIEILSPTQGSKELIDKFKVYFEAGIKSCWLVIPVARSIIVCTAPDRSTTFSDRDVVDKTLGLNLPIKAIFD